MEPTPDKSATRLKRQENLFTYHAFPNLETVVFVTFLDGKVMVMECFTKDDGVLKVFRLNNHRLFFGDNDMGTLLYASGLTRLKDYLLSIHGQEIVFIPANGGRLQAIL